MHSVGRECGAVDAPVVVTHALSTYSYMYPPRFKHGGGELRSEYVFMTQGYFQPGATAGNPSTNFTATGLALLGKRIFQRFSCLVHGQLCKRISPHKRSILQLGIVRPRQTPSLADNHTFFSGLADTGALVFCTLQVAEAMIWPARIHHVLVTRD